MDFIYDQSAHLIPIIEGLCPSYEENSFIQAHFNYMRESNYDTGAWTRFMLGIDHSKHKCYESRAKSKYGHLISPRIQSIVFALYMNDNDIGYMLDMFADPEFSKGVTNFDYNI